MGTFSRSWDLVKQSFAVLMSDKELMWLPVLSGIFCLFATVIIWGTGFLWLVPAGPLPQDPNGQKLLFQQMAPVAFLFYVVTYTIGNYFNVALVSIAADRLAGGHARLSDGLQIAWQRKWVILEWALLAATVGMVLQAFERRAKFLGRMIIGLVGVAWSLASFFVVPVLAAQNLGPIEALSKSAGIYRKTWGEQAVGVFSLGGVFFLFMLPAIAFPMFSVWYFGPSTVLMALAVAGIYVLVLSIVASAARGVFVAALYRYATTGQVPGGFDLNDFRGNGPGPGPSNDNWQSRNDLDGWRPPRNDWEPRDL